MTMTSNNPSINISVATKYLDPGERGAQVIKIASDDEHSDIDMLLLDVIIDHNFGPKEYHGVLF